MAYVGIKGGQEAIAAAAELREAMRAWGQQEPLGTEQIEQQMAALHGKVASEGGVYHPGLVSLALKQSLGDSLEAAFVLRAHAAGKSRVGSSNSHSTHQMRCIRRISAAMKDIPGGQRLGPTHDYANRLLRFDMLDENKASFDRIIRKWLPDEEFPEGPTEFPKVLDTLRQAGLLPSPSKPPSPVFEITKDPRVFPMSRSARLSFLTRGEAGGVLALAYSNMRGYGDIHPTVGELRVGYLPVFDTHPVTGEEVEVGEVLMTECELLAMGAASETSKPMFSVGYGACFGHNETKAIAMAVLDRAMAEAEETGKVEHPSQDPEFVILHIDGIDSLGFCNHYKMPHYVTFQADKDRVRSQQSSGGANDVRD